MKKLSVLVSLVLLSSISLSSFAFASHSVRGYTRHDGAYVQPHQSMNPGEARSSGFSYHDNQLVENSY